MIAKASKLDGFTEIITVLMQSGFTNGQIREKLKNKGCEVSLETVRKRINCLRESRNSGVHRRGKGRPIKSLNRALSFLPKVGTGQFPAMEIPLIFFKLLNGGSQSQHKNWGSVALMLLGVEGDALERYKIWARSIGKIEVSLLSDLEICLLTVLGGEVGPVPAGKSEPEIASWLKDLISEAVALRSAMRAEVGLTE